ncbi:MAG TPA: nitroreductase/quinone reductase family protein [Acidimicrobiales bacterium]|nr:nitroreductase/quinone reductase family protein [Acidimicrobiales bacterium]
MSEERDWTRVREWNAGIIEEFRAHEGKLGGRFAGEPVLLLHTFGAKSGLERINPMRYLDLEGRRFVLGRSGTGSMTSRHGATPGSRSIRRGRAARSPW